MMAHVSLPVLPRDLVARHLLVHGHLPPRAPPEARRARPAARPGLLPWVRVRFPGTPSHCHDMLVVSCSFMEFLWGWNCSVWSFCHVGFFSRESMVMILGTVAIETLWPVTRPRSFGPNDFDKCWARWIALARNIQLNIQLAPLMPVLCISSASLLSVSASSSTNPTKPQEHQQMLGPDGPQPSGMPWHQWLVPAWRQCFWPSILWCQVCHCLSESIRWLGNS